MSHDLSWSQAALCLCLGVLGFLLAMGLASVLKPRKKHNKRLGLPSPACNRVPDEFRLVQNNFTRRQTP